MQSFTFIHAADLHLGCPFKGLGASNPDVARAADRATFAALDHIVKLALDSNAAFVLFSGDIHDCADRNLKAQLRFFEGVKTLDTAGIPSCIIHGNHDHMGGEQANFKWPASTKIFLAKKDEPKIVEVNGTPIAAVTGYSYPRREVKESVFHHCRPREADRELFRIGMLHANVGGKEGHDNYCPCSVADLATLEIDYWALGHIHGHEILRGGAPAIVYPGSPQGLSIRETGVHGCCKVSVKANRECEIEFVPTDSLRWHQLEISIEGLESPEQWLERCVELLESISREGTLSHIVRIRAVGRGTLHKMLQAAEAGETMLTELRNRFSGEPFVWIDRIRIETQPQLDLAGRRLGEDLTGDFLRLCATARSDKEDWESLLKELNPVFGRQELSGLLPDIEQNLESWLLQAEILGAEHLLGEEQA